jgi:predicted secreted protein
MMARTRLYLFLAMLMVTLLFIPAVASDAQVLDENSGGEVMVIVEGQSLELSLPSNPSTGFSWQYFPEPDSSILKETAHEYRGGESNLIGAGGREYWTFQAAGTGSSTLSLAYMRPWESRMPEKIFKLEIKVSPQVKVQLDGKALDFDVPPLIEEGRTLVPLRALFEALGAEVIWNPETRQVTAQKEGLALELTVGSSEAYWKGPKDGHVVSLEVPPRIIGGRVLVPLRFVSEALGGRVDWDEATRTVRITSYI